MPLAFAADQKGILPDHMIAALARDGAILADHAISSTDQIQPASLDLRLGEVAYRVRASFLPGPQTTVAERIDELKLHENRCSATARCSKRLRLHRAVDREPGIARPTSPAPPIRRARRAGSTCSPA